MERMMVMLAVLSLLCCSAFGQEEPNGLTFWALAGDGVQEGRVGWLGLLPDIELAFGAQHVDAADPEIDEWPVRGYLIMHALDAQMLASFVGQDVNLPDGNLYAGLFTQYSHDREKEFAGGYCIGGLVAWPKGWQTVTEYSATLWNCDNTEHWFFLGLRRLLP